MPLTKKQQHTNKQLSLINEIS